MDGAFYSVFILVGGGVLWREDVRMVVEGVGDGRGGIAELVWEVGGRLGWMDGRRDEMRWDGMGWDGMGWWRRDLGWL